MTKKEMIGQHFGRLVVVAEGKKRTGNREARWICRCSCGGITHPISGYDLRSGHTLSCGCLHKELTAKAKTTHGKKGTRLYNIWQNMKSRCNNPKARFFNDYGGRGITVCEEWMNSFQSFYNWAMSHGYTDNLTIDRIDNGKGYFPDNCRWCSQEEQQNNKRNNLSITINGKTQTISQWAKESDLPKATIHWRYHHGLRGENLILPPHIGRNQHG